MRRWITAGSLLLVLMATFPQLGAAFTSLKDVALYDVHGKRVGWVVGFNGPDEVLLGLRVSATERAFLRATTGRISGESVLYFSLPRCEGTPYIFKSLEFSSLVPFGTVVDLDIYIQKAGVPGVSPVALSQLDDTGCTTFLVPIVIDFGVFVPAVKFGTVRSFDPPFSLR